MIQVKRYEGGMGKMVWALVRACKVGKGLQGQNGTGPV